MRSPFVKLLRCFIYLMALFTLCRVAFLLSLISELHPDTFSLFFGALYHALPLDISTASYLLFVPLLLLTSSYFTGNKLLHRVFDFYFLFVSLFYVLLSLSEIGIYQELHVKLYYNLFSRIFHPEEVLSYVSFKLFAAVFISIAVCGVSALLMYRFVTGDHPVPSSQSFRVKFLKAFSFLAVSAVLLVLGCRGGWQVIPINEGEVCFSKNACANDGAINALWNLGHSFIESRKSQQSNIYQTMETADAQRIFDELFAVEKDTTVSLFTLSKPNVCIIILEGWHNDMLKATGGYDSVAPFMNKLVEESYLFSNILSSGHISDQGIPAILSSFPALTFGSVINTAEKQTKLDCIGNEFNKAGYHTSFIYGGHLIYGGIKQYIYRHNFSVVMERKDMPALPSGQMGVHDSLTALLWRDSLSNFKSPFFSCYYTLSTHSPFDAPTHFPIGWGDAENSYLNSVAYSDRQLGNLFAEIKNHPLYDSTVFILVSDHGHRTPRNHAYDSKEHYSIPVLLTGGALKEEFKGKQNKRIGSQNDVAVTLLHQLNLPYKGYRWGKNLMNPYTNEFAFYTFNEGFGFCDNTGCMVWNKKYNRSTNTAATEKEKELLRTKGAALLQLLMDDFLAR
ncbi:MAG: sulfatase-like hydrolase/transferase [Chitinophagales bacterium]|nr:sulfatase-like hydrolase/transferase [Chitinophagales bacterium]